MGQRAICVTGLKLRAVTFTAPPSPVPTFDCPPPAQSCFPIQGCIPCLVSVHHETFTTLYVSYTSLFYPCTPYLYLSFPILFSSFPYFTFSFRHFTSILDPVYILFFSLFHLFLPRFYLPVNPIYPHLSSISPPLPCHLSHTPPVPPVRIACCLVNSCTLLCIRYANPCLCMHNIHNSVYIDSAHFLSSSSFPPPSMPSLNPSFISFPIPKTSHTALIMTNSCRPCMYLRLLPQYVILFITSQVIT